MKKITRFILLLAAIVAWGNVVNATNTECAGTSTETSTPAQGTFTLGYNYSFTTSGTDVTFTCELLDSKVGLVAYAWTYNPNFAETQMTQGTGQSFSKTFTGQTLNSTFSVACKFAFAGGMAVTKTFTYTVGNACGGSSDTQAPTLFTATKGTVGSNSVELLLNATDDSGAIAYTISYGTGPTVVTTSGVSATQKSYVVSGLAPSTAYSFSVVAKDAAGNAAANNPIVVSATTTAIPAPAVSAPTPPTYSAAKVISIFSDAYTNVAGTNLNPNWGQATAVSTIQVGTDNVLKYANLNYQGTQFGSDVTAVSMKYLHVDVWTPNETSLQIFCISHSTGEKYVQLTPLNLNAWNSFDIPLTSFTSQGLSMADLFQFKIVGAGGNIVYFDNLYFYDNTASVDTQAPTSFTATAGTIASDGVELLLNATDDSGAISYTISYGAGPTVVSTSGVSGVQKSYTISGLTASTAYSFSVVAKDATGNSAANSPVVVSATTLAGLPAAPTPTLAAAKVISIFSDAYTNVAATNFYPGWGQSTVASATTMGGNAAMKYTTFNYQGVELGSHVNASAMTKLHVDIYPTTETAVRITPISPGHELSISLTPLTANTWNSFDLLLSSFTGVVTSDIYQFKFDGGTGKTFYMDNLYFYNDTATGLNAAESSNTICYPNPVVDKLTVSAQSEISQVAVRNLLGQSVKVVSVNSTSKSIDLSSIASGHYFVTVKLANGQVSTQKLVKQ
ncbi:MAG: T9SS type A sorting domain-containing protein [Paludibacter sp.]|nr:T9SS type A sorting domain-containing protein [Paludibacter sp.]